MRDLMNTLRKWKYLGFTEGKVSKKAEEPSKTRVAWKQQVLFLRALEQQSNNALTLGWGVLFLSGTLQKKSSESPHFWCHPLFGNVTECGSIQSSDRRLPLPGPCLLTEY